MVRILIADDHDVIRAGLRDIIAGQADWMVCGEARNGREAVSRVKELKPDVVVLDFKMPNVNGLEAAQEIRKECPKTEILMISADSSEELIRTMLDGGIQAFINKGETGNNLIPAIKALLNHMPYLTPVVMENFIGRDFYLSDKRDNQLTPRE
jgi:DNA-binding NarL/FixJ family response regulator